MSGCDKRSLKKVRTLVGLLLEAMAEVVQQHCDEHPEGSGSGLVVALNLCHTSLAQTGVLADETLAGALHLALHPFRAVQDSKEFVRALVEVATQPLAAFVGEDAKVLEEVCEDQGNQESLLKWGRKLLKATEAALATKAEASG